MGSGYNIVAGMAREWKGMSKEERTYFVIIFSILIIVGILLFYRVYQNIAAEWPYVDGLA